jgi:acetyltransferase
MALDSNSPDEVEMEPKDARIKQPIEPAHDILRKKTQPLDVFFSPTAVAVIGASESPGSVGRTVLQNLIRTPSGATVFPVNPNRSSVLGIHAYPNIGAIPQPADLAVVVTPAATVPGIIRECVDAGVKGAIVISAGFKESGPRGTELEEQVQAQARRADMRIIGPNCLGVMNPVTGLNATFAGSMARAGSVAFVSQSGALCTSVLDWSLREFVGFSAFISVGSMVDVGWGDLIDFLGDDPRTRSIVLYMESVGDARAFLSAAREVALTKPIIVIKAGRTEAAARAAASHTGALTGRDEVLEAAFRRSGVLRVTTIADLFSMADVLAKQPRPRGPRLAILTNAGGPGVLATDTLITNGGELASLSDDTIAELNKLLPEHWSHSNPIDILGDAGPQRYARAVEIVAQDSSNDGVLVILTPQAMTDPTQTAEQLKPHSNLNGKPLLASWMGGLDISAGASILNQANIPNFPYPDSASRAFVYMWRYSDNLRGLYETPTSPLDGESVTDLPRAKKVIEQARQSGRSLLTEVESKQVVAAYGIPTVETRIALSRADAVKCATAMGYPVVLKLFSHTLTHKTDVGGVHLDLPDAKSVRNAYDAIRASITAKAGGEHFQGVTVQPMVQARGYEIILGSSLDPQFGPVLLFGLGGQLVEVFKDTAHALPPLNTTLARRMMERTQIFEALKGVRGRRPVDLAALERILVQFSQLVVDQRWIKEIDINPLLVSDQGTIALDARVVLHEPDMTEDKLPSPVIRPYPSQYQAKWKLKDGTPLTIRPIRPEDEPLMVKFHETLSEQSVYFRYFHHVRLSQRVAHERLTRMCFIDYARQMALVAERRDPKTGVREILAVGRLIKLRGTNEAEFAILISDRLHRSGLGTELLRRLVEIGRDEKLDRIVGDILPENQGMLRVCEKLGFRRRYSIGDQVIKAELDLER